MPKWLLWLVGPMVNSSFTRRTISRNMGYPWKFDNAKAKRELGMEFKPVEPAIIEMFQQMADAGTFKKA